VVEVHHVARVDVLGHKAESKMARFGSVALHTPRLKITLPASARTLISGASALPSRVRPTMSRVAALKPSEESHRA